MDSAALILPQLFNGLSVASIYLLAAVGLALTFGLQDDPPGAVARAVGLNPEPLVAQYDAEHGGRPEPTPAAPLFEAERIRSDPRRPNWSAAMVAAIVAVVSFVGFTLFSDGDKDERGPVAGGDTNADQPAPAPTKAHTTKPPKPDPSDSAIAGLPKDKVTIKVTARDGQSWISAKDANGKLLQDGIKVSAWVHKENPDLSRWVSVSTYQCRDGRTGVKVDGRPVDGPEQERRQLAIDSGEKAPF